MRALALTILAVLTLSARGAAQCSDAEKTKLQEFDKAWSEATNRGDRAFLQAAYADDFAGVSLTGTTDKAGTIDGAIRTAERNRANPQAVPTVAADNYVIACTPTTATVTHRNVITTTAGGREQTTYSRSVHIFEKRGGRWQVVSNAGHPLTDASVLLYMESDWNEALKKRDTSWFERNYANDATDVSSRTGAILSKADVITSLKTDRGMLESIDLSETNVRVDGTTAIVTGVARFRGRDETGKPFDRRLRFTDTFIKRDGRWLVWASQGTAIP